jgi:hypothetical protein
MYIPASLPSCCSLLLRAWQPAIETPPRHALPSTLRHCTLASSSRPQASRGRRPAAFVFLSNTAPHHVRRRRRRRGHHAVWRRWLGALPSRRRQRAKGEPADRAGRLGRSPRERPDRLHPPERAQPNAGAAASKMSLRALTAKQISMALLEGDRSAEGITLDGQPVHTVSACRARACRACCRGTTPAPAASSEPPTLRRPAPLPLLRSSRWWGASSAWTSSPSSGSTTSTTAPAPSLSRAGRTPRQTARRRCAPFPSGAGGAPGGPAARALDPSGAPAQPALGPCPGPPHARTSCAR